MAFTALPRPTRVTNMNPSLFQITAEVSDNELRTRKYFEDRCPPFSEHVAEWIKFAKWEESQKYFPRARSIFERALELNGQNPTLWINYAEFEMRNGFVDQARDVWDRALSILTSVDQLWYKYIHMEEVTLGNIPNARQVFERWMESQPDARCWISYASFELRYREVGRARDIYERLVRCDISPDAWARYAKFEMKHGEVERCLAIYMRATDIVHPEDRETLSLAFAQFDGIRTQVEHRGLASKAVNSSSSSSVPHHVKREVCAPRTSHKSCIFTDHVNCGFHASKLRKKSSSSDFHPSEKKNGSSSALHLVKKSRHIPHDLMLNVLSRVPARSLVRFRCACKLWNSLFHDRYFVKLQLSHSSKNPTTFIGCSIGDRDRVDFFSFEIEGVKLVRGDKFTMPVVPAGTEFFFRMANACDGLIAFYGSHFGFHYAYVANPSTHEWMAVPMVSPKCPSLGLGFSVDTEKYKLVWIYYDGLGHVSCSCDVFTVGTDTMWRRLGEVPYRVNTDFSPVYSNGFIYWTVHDADFILAFNVSQEDFLKIQLPQRHHPKPYGKRAADHHLCMRILEGSVCLVDWRVYQDHQRSSYVPFMHVYVLERHSAVEGGDPPIWRESHSLRLRSVKVRPSGKVRPRGPAVNMMLPAFIRDGKLLLFRLGKSWRLHDMLTGACPTIKMPQDESSWSSFTCAASIVPIDRA